MSEQAEFKSRTRISFFGSINLFMLGSGLEVLSNGMGLFTSFHLMLSFLVEKRKRAVAVHKDLAKRLV